MFAYGEELLVGPLAVPGEAGCVQCVLTRLKCTEHEQPSGSPTEATYLKAAELTPLRDRVYIVRDREVSTHAFLPVPQCPVCGSGSPRKVEAVTLDENSEPEAVLDAFAGCVDARLGIVSQIIVEQPEDTGIAIPLVVTAMPPRVVVDGEMRTLPSGWGKGLTLSGALLSAIGESMERYSASLPDPSLLHYANLPELDGDVLDPREFPLYNDAQYNSPQFPFRRFDPQAVHPWVKGRWLNGGPVWVPAIFAYLSLDLTPEQLFCQGTSNGLAASTSADDACHRAMWELIERDAFMTTWITGSAGRRIQEPRDENLSEVLQGIRNLGAQIELYELPTAVPGHAVLCLALGDGENFPGVTIGLGADAELQRAVRQAILEVGQTGPYLRRIMKAGILTAPENPEDVREMLHHAAFYFRAERGTAFDSLRGKGSIPPKRENSPRIAIVDVTSADLRSSPFHVYRAVSPDLQPISYGYGLDRVPLIGTSYERAIHPIW